MVCFYNWNDKILVDFNSNVDFETNDKDFYVFVVKNEENYHIVGWCVNGILKNKRIKVSAKKKIIPRCKLCLKTAVCITDIC